VAEPVVVRRAVLADAEAGARCHAACWREGYADFVEPDLLAALAADLDGRIESWTRQLSQGDERWIAVDGDEIVGLASAGPNRDEDLPDLIELYSCYARAAYWGTGLGRRLMQAAVADQPASLWVFDANARARRFYRKHGFVEDGSLKAEPRFGADEIRMVRDG